MAMTTFLAQLLTNQESEKKILIWGAVLIGVVLIACVIAMFIRRWLKEPLAGANQDPGFSLSDLRDMRDRGEITPEEYEQTRARVIAKVKGKGDSPGQSNPPAPG